MLKWDKFHLGLRALLANISQDASLSRILVISIVELM